VLYEMVTGRVPFDGETAVTVAVKHLQEEMVPPSTYCRDIPFSLEQIIRKCMEKSPDRRYQDIGDLLADLKQSLMDPEGDFVQMVDLDEQAKTVIMTKKTTAKVRSSRKVERVEEPDDEDEDDDEYDEEYDDEDEDDDEELSPTVEKIMTIAGAALAVIIVIVLFLLVSNMLGLGKNKDSDDQKDQQIEENIDDEEEPDSQEEEGTNTVVMPKLLGKTMTEAKIELEALGLKITLKGSESSAEYAAGQIIEQSVDEGKRVAVGTNIDVVIAGAGSGGGSSTSTSDNQTTTTPAVEEVKVPNVEGQTEANARAALEAAGLKVGTVSESKSDTVPMGNVITQSVSKNTSVTKGTSVNLVLSSGPNKVKVTDVIGHESSRAQGELAGDGFNVSVKEEHSEERAGLVIGTSPERGTLVDPGSTVTIIVSKGRAQVTIPDVRVGMTYEEAVEELEDAGFEGDVEEVLENSDSVGEGFVTRYSPSTKVDPNGKVTIYVSLGPQSALAE